MMNGQVPDLQTVGELGMDLGVRRERESFRGRDTTWQGSQPPQLDAGVLF